MDVHAKQRELFFNNLLILEFDKSAVENEYRVKCDKDMFSLPNQKMFEVVTHFLFEKLNEVSEKEYNLPWPLMDKEQRRQFQKTSVNYLSSIAQTRKYWKQLQIFLDKEKQFWEYLFPIIKENPEMFLLDGAQLKLDIGDFIKEQCSELNEMGSVETKEEKVSLLKYLNIYYIFLKLYEKTFLKGDLLQIKELSNVQKIWSFESNINELKTLHEKLLATVLNIKENNKMLEDRLFLEEISEDLQIFTKECSSWNFSSKSFQDEINTSRLIYTDNITDDVLKTSLFTNDSGLESDYHKTRNIRESWLLEESLDSVTLPETSFLD
ncbi:hypothetical protein HNY73_001802 [Argiope bruennichi]|uniref:HAUS augmin-like complex subunit 6 N-terminal domain-containing protein n=1 Tax=Argiope bruennichi TaxID=94029 RepID=A0A8T0FW17_ARGBR|nr:hypothetical protein HNY73_001802 [Argiope bruennichi]